MNNLNPNDYIVIAGSSTVTLTDNTTLASPAVDMSLYDSVLFIINATDANADTTIDAKLQTDTASGMSSPTDVSGSSITQGTLANASEVYAIQVRSDQLSERYVRCLATLGNGTTGGNTSIIALGVVPNYKKADNAATVIEVVTV